MAHCCAAKAWLQCSSTGVYQPAGQHPLRETDPLGDNDRVMMETYSLSKIAAEVVASTGAREHGLPTTIARLNVPYGDNGGWPAFHLAMIEEGQPVPVHPDRPNLFNPVHHDDIVRMVPALLDAATTPATSVNWGGVEQVALETWCEELADAADAAGVEAASVETEATIGGVTIDTTRIIDLVGPTRIEWRDGMRRLVEAHRA